MTEITKYALFLALMVIVFVLGATSTKMIVYPKKCTKDDFVISFMLIVLMFLTGFLYSNVSHTL